MMLYLLSLFVFFVLTFVLLLGKNINRRALFFLFLPVSILLLATLTVNFYWRDTSLAFEVEESDQSLQMMVSQYLSGQQPQGIENIEVGYFVRALQVYLQGNSRDVDAWLVLGNILRASESPDLALRAYERAYRVSPDDAQIALNYVNARLEFAKISGRKTLDKEAIEVLEELLYQKPDHANALMLLGAAAYQGGDFALAQSAWQKLLGVFESREGKQSVPDDVIMALRESIEKAKQFEQEQMQVGDLSLEVKVSLSAELKEGLGDNLSQNSALFVFIKALEKPDMKMPLAAKRLPLSDNTDFPVELTISQQDSLMGLDLSKQGKLSIAAHISFEGLANKTEGDWFSEVIGFTPSDSSTELIQLDINAVVE